MEVLKPLGALLARVARLGALNMPSRRDALIIGRRFSFSAGY
jgi:hypothetical protein